MGKVIPLPVREKPDETISEETRSPTVVLAGPEVEEELDRVEEEKIERMDWCGRPALQGDGNGKPEKQQDGGTTALLRSADRLEEPIEESASQKPHHQPVKPP